MPQASRVTKANPVGTSRKGEQRSRPVKVTAGDLQVPVRKARASSCPRVSQGPQRGPRGAPRPGNERRARSTIRETDAKESGGPPGKHGAVTREAKHAPQSHKAFTIIHPDPKKRREIQEKAAAELAALEELRLSRAMTYVSINPSSVGGCMSLEEVRLKQQQEMMQAKRKQKPIQVMKHTPVLRS